jgi:hypothetical protein
MDANYGRVSYTQFEFLYALEYASGGRVYTLHSKRWHRETGERSNVADRDSQTLGGSGFPFLALRERQSFAP